MVGSGAREVGERFLLISHLGSGQPPRGDDAQPGAAQDPAGVDHAVRVRSVRTLRDEDPYSGWLGLGRNIDCPPA